MCDTCGCGQPDEAVTFRKAGSDEHSHLHDHQHNQNHTYEHGHDHTHDNHSHDHSHSRTLEVEQDVLSKNNLLAERNRGYFMAKNMLTLNLVSSPGSGKTTLLEKTIRALKDEIPITIIEGDQQTMQDADRIHAAGVPVIQVNTGNGCHLDANMVEHSISELKPQNDSIMFIENVGNLVCPALFDLGEASKVVVISTTEGDDKPLKYPTMFSVSDICIINKIDLSPYVNFDIEKCKSYALKVNPNLTFFEVSATNGDGMEKWYNWLREQISTKI